MHSAHTPRPRTPKQFLSGDDIVTCRYCGEEMTRRYRGMSHLVGSGPCADQANAAGIAAAKKTRLAPNHGLPGFIS